MKNRDLLIFNSLLASLVLLATPVPSNASASASLKRTRSHKSSKPTKGKTNPTTAVAPATGMESGGGGVSSTLRSHRDVDTSGGSYAFSGREVFIPGDFESINEGLTQTGNGDKLHIQNGRSTEPLTVTKLSANSLSATRSTTLLWLTIDCM